MRYPVILATISLFYFHNIALAVPADPTPKVLRQPDGHKVRYVKRGDERGTWVETVEGYTIAQGPDHYWYYVQGYEEDEPRLTRDFAHLNPDPSLNLDLHIHPNIFDQLPDPNMLAYDDSQLLVGPHSGKVLIISVEFTDQSALYHESVWADRIQNIDPDAKTIADYYSEASYGIVSLTPAEETYGIDDNGVIGPLQLNRCHPNFITSNCVLRQSSDYNAVYEEAIAEADPFIDFASFDTNGDGAVDSSELAIVIIAAGYEAAQTLQTPSLHGHAHISPAIYTTADHDLQGNSIFLSYQYAMIGERHNGLSGEYAATLGIFAHELAHLIYGLPDLYDLDYSSSGIESYGLMALGSWGMDKTIDQHAGETPVLPTAWSQLKLGWVGATDVFPNGLTTAGRQNLPTTQHQVGIAYQGRLDKSTGQWNCYDNQYFLMQYRTAEGYDRGLVAVNDGVSEYSGVVIYQIDERVSTNRVDSLRLVDVEEADNTSLDVTVANYTDLWYQGGVDIFDAVSTPSSELNMGAGDSGVSVSILSPQLDAQGENSVGLAISAACN